MNKNKQQHLSPENYIRTRARNLPLGTCYINNNWRETGFCMIIVTRVSKMINLPKVIGWCEAWLREQK